MAKKTHKFRPGTVALREIRRYQKSADPLIPYKPFVTFLRGITGEGANPNMRWQKVATFAAREIIENFLVSICENANNFAIHAHRVTVMTKDIELASEACKSNMHCLAFNNLAAS